MNEPGEPTLTFSGDMKMLQPANPWARISEIAARLGVPPHQKGDPATITAEGADGEHYDLWAVIAAMLDKLDAASK